MPKIPENMSNDALNRTDVEAPGGSQATHAADLHAGAEGELAETNRSARERVAKRVDRVGDTLERRALELELKGGIKAKAAPVVRRAGRAADASAAYVRENDVEAMRNDLEDSIREHPLRSMAIAVGAGYLLARLLD